MVHFRGEAVERQRVADDHRSGEHVGEVARAIPGLDSARGDPEPVEGSSASLILNDSIDP